MEDVIKPEPKTEMNPKDIAAQTRAPLHLIPAVGAIYGSMACRLGAKKYGPYNWREKNISLMEYIGAIERHAARLKDGEWIDQESKQPHLGHINAITAILLDANECETLNMDWPTQEGYASDVLDKIETKLKEEADA